MNLVSLILIAVVAAIAGALVGFIYATRGTNNAKRNAELQEKFSSTERELKQYRQEVSRHFQETAQLVDNLTEAYRAVHNHLAISASELTPATLEGPLLKTLPDKEELDALSTAPIPKNMQAPLDYAPKSAAANRVGMLDETYGLDEDTDSDNENQDQTVIAAR